MTTFLANDIILMKKNVIITNEQYRIAKEENKLKSNKKIQIKIICILVIFTMLFYIFLNIINENRSYAVQTRESYSSKINNYPGYKELIDKLKVAHPNWNFTIFYTGLDWNQVIKNETTARHGRNLISSSKPTSWICSICGDKKYDNGSWRCASEAAVSYYMDPRNSLNDDYIFQFENLSYNSSIQNINGVNQILKDVGYMQGSTITYTDTNGNKQTINKSYAQVIMEAASEAKISPYHLAARIRQEQGTGSSPSVLASGTYSGYVGYYNFLNIKASGGSTATIITNGLNYAKSNGLTNPEKSIKAGAKFLAKDYITTGQDTLYLQKFDVDSSDGSLYYFQYMQNVSASKSEGNEVKNSYQKLGLLNSNIDFIIPVYENMPDTACPEPGIQGIVTNDVKVKGTNVYVRSGPNTSSSIIKTVNTGDVLLKIETANSMNNGYYWDKVVLPDGRKGYIARNFIVDIANITNCNDTVIANTSVNLRNGPGTEGTTVITTLVKGQILTRIETGKYNLNGYIWDRVVLSDGRKGYIAQNYIDKSDNGSTNTGELIKVICNSGLKVREKPGTGQKVLTYLDKNDILTRTQSGASNANGYVWDKIVTSNGIEGYVARGDSKEQYIEVIKSNDGNNNGNNSNTSPDNDNFKLQDTNLVCEPKTTVDSIKEKYSDKNIIIKKPDGTQITTGNVGTGYIVTIGNTSYTTVKLGDINGDGKITPADSTAILRAYVGLNQLSDVAKMATDVNKDNKTTPADSTAILRAYVELSTINLY